EIVYRVIDKFIAELEGQLGERDVKFRLTNAARAWLAERGYDRLYGARPLARVIQRYVKEPLADEVLFGKLTNGGTVLIDADEEKLLFDVRAKGEDDG